jgi:creatinine amidohydrolase
MREKVHYEELSPEELVARLKKRPVGYLPLGTLEWHGAQCALGADSIQARGLFERAALRFGGVVFPPLWLGPDRIAYGDEGRSLIGMDTDATTLPAQQLPGSCYWVPEDLFIAVCEAVLSQARRAGFRCVLADGHGPSRLAWGRMADAWEHRFDLKILSAVRDFPDGAWKTQMDHAGKNETSVMMAIRPDLVDLSRLTHDRSVWPKGVAGEDPRDASADYGEAMLEATLAAIGKRIAGISWPG